MRYRYYLIVPLLIIFHGVAAQKPPLYTPVQLTNGQMGHTLNSTQCISANDEWVVFDTRNEDTKIGTTSTIGILNLHTGEIKTVYQNPATTIYGPGVGAATFSPAANRVMFIHGIRNADSIKPYGSTRRTGVSIDIAHPNVLSFMDARNVYPPFTPGALRGGTHAHSWSHDGKWVSFTYNDAIMERLGKDRRTVGIMVPGHVRTPKDSAGENNDGEMFAMIAATVTTDPKPGSDEIDKAFDECWVGNNGYLKPDGSRQHRAIAFQGNVREMNGRTKTEVFLLDLPESLPPQDISALAGANDALPPAPPTIRQRRLTYTAKGIEGPRYWLRSTPDGSLIAFLARDSAGFINIFGVSPNGGPVTQLSRLPFNIQGGINFSPDGRYLVYFADNAICLTDIHSRHSYKLVGNLHPYGAVSWSHNGKTLLFNQYVKHPEGGEWLQIFSVNLDHRLSQYLQSRKI